MKTPREILLARHKAMEPKLDDVRQVALRELNSKGGASRTGREAQSFADRLVSFFLSCPNAVWRELIVPSRTIWASLAAIWILILAANFSMRDHSQTKMVKSAASPEVIMAFRQQQQLLNELIGPGDPPVAEAQKSYLPRPASERRIELLTT